tara:strand:- start:379 stop:852 length:474 start_codon:yes stop_codon:yes gene_type:complete
MIPKTKKSKKAKKQRGSRTQGQGAMKRGSGHRGGIGMAGSGKRADHKKSLITTKYGNKYFGKQGITSKRTAKRRLKTINIRSILERFSNKSDIDLKDYKILGDGEITKALTIKAKAFTKSAKEKIEKAGGKIIVPEIKVKEVKKPVEKKEEKTETNK